MTVNEERVSIFVRLYEEEFGQVLPRDEARDLLLRLVNLYAQLARSLDSESARRPLSSSPMLVAQSVPNAEPIMEKSDIPEDL